MKCRDCERQEPKEYFILEDAKGDFGSCDVCGWPLDSRFDDL